MMKKIKNSLFYFILVLFSISDLFFSYATYAKNIHLPVEAKTSIDKSSVTIGDKVRYAISVSFKKDIEVELPHFGQNLGDFAIKDFGTINKSSGGARKITEWYLLDTYVTGKATIPKVVIKYREKGENAWQELEAGAQEIDVKSILDKAGLKASMRDIKDPINLPSGIKRYVILGIFAFIVAAVILGTFIFKKRKSATLAIPKKPAHEIAYEELNNLKSRNLIAEGKIKEYYFEISDIIRHYLENRFKFKAPEMTTEEFLASAGDSSQLKREYRDSLREFLVSCDLVKFAKYAPSEQEVDSIFESAKNFINDTKEQDELS